MPGWQADLRGDPLQWLLDERAAAVRARALIELVGLRPDDPKVVATRAAAMASDPIASVLAAQDPEGWWVKPGPGYAPKYGGTVWSLILLDQLGADPVDQRVARACDYVLAHAQSSVGGFAASGSTRTAPPPPSLAIHCLNGNLLAALIGLGRLDDPRVAAAVAWQAAVVTGDGGPRRTALVPGPGFRCGANDGAPCAWGAIRVVSALARIPREQRSEGASRALSAGVELLLSRDPAAADYPMGYGNIRPSRSWFRLGFPQFYVADVLGVLEALCAAGAGGDPRLDHALDWVLDQRDPDGRWANRYAYTGKLARDIDQPGRPSRWVTLRALRVLKAVAEERAAGARRVGPP
jgi:hypothetical protein